MNVEKLMWVLDVYMFYQKKNKEDYDYFVNIWCYCQCLIPWFSDEYKCLHTQWWHSEYKLVADAMPPF